jgi:hypothetical protein
MARTPAATQGTLPSHKLSLLLLMLSAQEARHDTDKPESSFPFRGLRSATVAVYLNDLLHHRHGSCWLCLQCISTSSTLRCAGWGTRTTSQSRSPPLLLVSRTLCHHSTTHTSQSIHQVIKSSSRDLLIAGQAWDRALQGNNRHGMLASRWCFIYFTIDGLYLYLNQADSLKFVAHHFLSLLVCLSAESLADS